MDANDQPWERVKQPPPIPGAAGALRAMGDAELTQLLRSHLLPRSGAQARHDWERLWDTLGADGQLTARALDILDGLAAATATALNGSHLDEAARARAEKFHHHCTAARHRLEPGEPRPLAWAGRHAAQFNPAARRVIDDLIHAIAEHRRSTHDPRPPDEQLWAVMTHLGLDPGAKTPPQGRAAG